MEVRKEWMGKEATSKTIEPLTVHNLLPCDLFLEIKVAGEIQKARLERESLPVYFDAKIRIRIDAADGRKIFLFNLQLKFK